jgi:EAL domain-containing protein (putative c-di-GMP-specific phosphodiesterase class I)
LSIDLGVDLIVEGVANKELFLILRQIGCKIFQGYYFFQPLPSEEVEYLIRKNLLDQFDKVNL